MNAQGGGHGGGGQGGMPSAQQQQQLFASLQQAMQAQQQRPPSQQQQQQHGGMGAPGFFPQQQGHNVNGAGNLGAMMGMPGFQQQQQAQPQQPQQQQAQSSPAVQNPTQLLTIVAAQIQNLQRQYQTVQQQADSPQKMEAIQHLATQMKKMKMIQAQTMQAVQGRQQQQQPQQAQQSGGSAGPSHQGGTPQQQQPLQAPTPQPSAATPQQHNAPTPMAQSAPTPQFQPQEAPSPAHNSQLAALQAFAQQQRMQASNPNGGNANGNAANTPGSSRGGNQQWQPDAQQQNLPQQMQSPMAPPQPPQHQALHGLQQQQQQQQNGPGSRPSSSGAQQPQQNALPNQQQQQPGGKPDLLSAVRAFMAQRGTPLPPNLPMAFVGPQQGAAPGQTKAVDAQTLFAMVLQVGGSARISAQANGWAIVASKLGLLVAPTPSQPHPSQPQADGNGTPLPPFVAPRLAQFYRERFASFEDVWLSRTKGGDAANQNQGQTQQQQQQQQQAATQGHAPNRAALPNGSPSPFPQQAPTPGPSAGLSNMAGPSVQHPAPPGMQAGPSAPLQQQQQPQQQQTSQHMAPNQPPNAPQNMPQGLQELLRKAAEVQATLPQQMQQLQMLVASGKMTQEQARERAGAMQNSARMIVTQAQQQRQAFLASTSGQAMQNQGSPQLGQQMPPPQQTPRMSAASRPMTPAVQSIPQSPMGGQGPAQAMQPGMDGHIGQGPRPGSSQGNMGPPPQASQPPPPRAATPIESKKPAKRARKPTGSSVKPGNVKAESQEASPTRSDARPPTAQATPAPQQDPALNQMSMNAQNAAHALQQGILAPPQQLNAFAAIRTLQLQNLNADPNDVFPAAQVAAQAYGRILMQAHMSGSPLPAVALSAFAAAQQEMARLFPVSPAKVGPSANAIVPGNDAAPAEVHGNPTKYKVEYMPVRRDVRTLGGWDMDFVEGHLGGLLAGRGRLPRSVRDMGVVDIEGLIMSLRSRLDVEVSYALNAILLLSAGIQAPGFQFLLGLCEDLMDELLDLLEESALRNDRTLDDGEISIAMPKKPLSLEDWISGALEEADSNKITKRQTTMSAEDAEEIQLSPSSYFEASAEDRARSGSAARALLLIEILYNLAAIPANASYFNGQPRVYKVLMNIIAATELEEQARRRKVESPKKVSEPAASPRLNGYANGHDSPSADSGTHQVEEAESTITATPPFSTVFTAEEALRIRKDVVFILANIGKDNCQLPSMDDTTARSIIVFLATFVEDAQEMESQHGTVYREMFVGASPRPEMQPVIRKVPHLSDLALEAFSSIAQPDANRELLGKLFDDDFIIHFCTMLTRLLPVTELDFHMLKTEARLGYCERIAMSLYNLAYLGSANVKRALKTMPGVRGVIVRCIKRLMRVTPDHSKNPFGVLTRRLVETLRVLNDGEILFDRPPLLGFGMTTSAAAGDGASSSSADRGTRKGNAAAQGSFLINDEDSIFELMTMEGADPEIFAEFEQML